MTPEQMASMNQYLYSINPSLNPMPMQQPMAQQQQNQPSYWPMLKQLLQTLGKPQSGANNMLGQQQNQQPSWLDTLNQSLMQGNMQPQQYQFNPYAMGNMGGNQAPTNWWQKGLQGGGTLLSGAAPLASTAGAGLIASGVGSPLGVPLLAGGVAAGGLGSLFQHLGQPGQQAQLPQGGWAA